MCQNCRSSQCFFAKRIHASERTTHWDSHGHIRSEVGYDQESWPSDDKAVDTSSHYFETGVTQFILKYPLFSSLHRDARLFTTKFNIFGEICLYKPY